MVRRAPIRRPSPTATRHDPDGHTWATRHLHFRDPRTPQVLQHLLEREFMVLLPARMVDEALECHGTAAVNGALCQIRLRFLAALPRTNAYFLELTLSWADLPPEHHDYHRQTAAIMVRPLDASFYGNRAAPSRRRFGQPLRGTGRIRRVRPGPCREPRRRPAKDRRRPPSWRDFLHRAQGGRHFDLVERRCLCPTGFRRIRDARKIPR